MFSKTLLLDACISDDEDTFIEDNAMIDITPKFVQNKALIPHVSMPLSRQSSTNSSKNKLAEIDLNVIRTRLDVEFSDAPDVCERQLVILNGHVSHVLAAAKCVLVGIGTCTGAHGITHGHIASSSSSS